VRANSGNAIIRHLRRAVLLQVGGGLTDGQLLAAFINRQDETAFAALVRRHGPMVLNVCRRVLRNAHDADDAFQATFLVLVRKAGSIGLPELLANWLYGVAYNTARKARAAASKRRQREKPMATIPEPPMTEPALWQDLQPLLDQELSRLPEKYRVPIILCNLEGKSIKTMHYDTEMVKVYDVKGKRISTKNLPELLKKETVALAATDVQAAHPLNLRLFKEGTLLFILPPSLVQPPPPFVVPPTPVEAPITPPSGAIPPPPSFPGK
jgi:RNA polymerase sigma factor (sigma-70 family)